MGTTRVLILAVVLALASAGVVWAETLDDFIYQVNIVVVNDSGSDLSSTPIAINMQPDNLVGGGYIQADAEDLRPTNTAENALDILSQGMDSDDVTWWLETDSVPDGGATTFYLHMGDSTASRDQDFLVDGTTDTITASDHADLDITDDLLVEMAINLNDWPVSDTYLLEKEEAYHLGVRTDGGVETIFAAVFEDTSDSVELMPNASGDFENIPGEDGCAPGSHWECERNKVLYRVEGADSNNTTQDAYNVDAFAPTDASILQVDIDCDVLYAGAGVYVGLRLGSTTGTLQRADSPEDCGGTVDFARPGGGSWTSSDMDSVQIVLEIREDDNGVDEGVWWVSLVVDYEEFTPTEVSTTTDGSAEDLEIDTAYTVRLTYDGGAVELSVNGGGSDGGFDGTTADFSLATNSNAVVVGSGVDGNLDAVIIGNLQSEVRDASFEADDPPLADHTEAISGSHTATTARSTAFAKYGDASLEVDVTDSSGGAGSGRYQEVAVAADEVWSFGIWAHVTALTGGGRARFMAQFKNAGDSTLAEHVVYHEAVTSGFVLLVIENKTAPATTAKVRLWDLGDTQAASEAVTVYFDGVVAVKASSVPVWQASDDVLEWDFEPDDLEETQQGNSGNSWTWTGTVEDVSTNGSDHDGTYSLTRDMSGLTIYSTGLELKESEDVTFEEAIADVLKTSGMDPAGVESSADFPLRGIFDTGLGSTGATLLASWFILLTVGGLSLSIMVFLWSRNEFLAVMPWVAAYFIGWKLGMGIGLWVPLVAALVGIAAAGGIRKLSQEG